MSNVDIELREKNNSDVSVRVSTSIIANGIENNQSAELLSRTPHRHNIMENIPSTPHTMQFHLSGEVTLTPTHRSFTPQIQSGNPHSSMTAITPMASAVSQAKSSIKFQYVLILHLTYVYIYEISSCLKMLIFFQKLCFNS